MGNFAGKLKELFSGSKHIELCLVGLENSGKTTILNILSSGYPTATMPTVGLNVKSFEKKGVTMKVWDLGGQEQFRGEWSRYTNGCDVVLFVVDSNDFERVIIAQKELHTLLAHPTLHGLPLLVVLNKQDLEPHMDKEKVIEELKLEDLTNNQWMVTAISAKRRQNMEEMLEWLNRHAKK